MARMLVVDDAMVMRAILRKILRGAGHDVFEAPNGSVALDVLADHPDMDVALVDWNMPVMTGGEFLQAVRSQQRFDALRVMIVTSDSELQQVSTALSMGATEYIMKPFTEEAVLEKIALMMAIRV